MIRRLFKAPRGWSCSSPPSAWPAGSAIAIKIPEPTDASAHYPTAFGGSWSVAGVTVHGADVGVLIMVPAAVILLGLVPGPHHDRQDGQGVAPAIPTWPRLSGIIPKLVSTMVWAMAAVLATLSMVLIAGESSTAARLATLGSATLAEPWPLP